MLKQISNFGRKLAKKEQMQINGGWGGPCQDYSGPLEVTCEQYFALPPRHQVCVDYDVSCEGG